MAGSPDHTVYCWPPKATFVPLRFDIDGHVPITVGSIVGSVPPSPCVPLDPLPLPEELPLPDDVLPLVDPLAPEDALLVGVRPSGASRTRFAGEPLLELLLLPVEPPEVPLLEAGLTRRREPAVSARRRGAPAGDGECARAQREKKRRNPRDMAHERSSRAVRAEARRRRNSAPAARARTGQSSAKVGH